MCANTACSLKYFMSNFSPERFVVKRRPYGRSTSFKHLKGCPGSLVGDTTVRGGVEQKREEGIKEEEEEGENLRVDGKGVGESTADEEIAGRGHWKKGGD